MVLARKSNLYFGTSVLSDLNEVRVIDTSETLGDRNARFVEIYLWNPVWYFRGDSILYIIIIQVYRRCKSLLMLIKQNKI